MYKRWFLLTPLLCLLTEAAWPAPREMKTAADTFINALSDEQKSTALFPFEADFRNEWYFVPDRSLPQKVRRGLCLKDMAPEQRALAHALLNSALSQKGFLQAMQVRLLEQVLHEIENKAPHRDPALYYVSIFGTPSDTTSWSWRYEGHHLSINVTVIDGTRVSMTPAFYGSNPGRVHKGPHKDLWVLHEEQHYARKLMLTMSDEQKKQAIIGPKAPRDILTRQSRKADRNLFNPDAGIPADELKPLQQELLKQLIAVYTGKARREIVAQVEDRKPTFDVKTTRFGWMGGLAEGDKHYYRIQTGDHLFEYDNVQNDANHIHAVWRGFNGDFGEDLLKKHLEEAHAESN